MAIELTPLHPTLGASVRGVDLTRPVLPEVFAEIDAAFSHYGILVFPEQAVTDEQQLAFSRLFGPLEVNPNYAGAKMRLRPDVADISNLDTEGRVLARDDRRNLFNLGNQLWHTDSSFKRVPAKCSLLSARELPGPGPMGGGETEFADLRAAWDALPEARRAGRARRRAQHLPLAQSDRLCRFQRRDLQAIAAGAAGLGPPPPLFGPHQSLSCLARLAHHRLAGRGGEGFDRRADRVCDPAAIRLSTPLDRRRPLDVGQSLHDASWPTL
jgi:alpha-ketoglutarate-dependent taurine dioxygenase